MKMASCVGRNKSDPGPNKNGVTEGTCGGDRRHPDDLGHRLDDAEPPPGRSAGACPGCHPVGVGGGSPRSR